MNKKIQENISELVKELLEVVKDSRNLVIGEGPKLVEELLNWSFFSSSISTVLTACLGIILSLITIYLIQNTSIKENLLFLFPGSLSLIMFFVAFLSAMEAIKIKKAPRLFLIEYLKELGSSSKDK